MRPATELISFAAGLHDSAGMTLVGRAGVHPACPDAAIVRLP
jgi:hypothetical protein